MNLVKNRVDQISGGHLEGMDWSKSDQPYFIVFCRDDLYWGRYGTIEDVRNCVYTKAVCIHSSSYDFMVIENPSGKCLNTKTFVDVQILSE